MAAKKAKKKSSAKQLAARRKFVAAAKARSKAAKRKKVSVKSNPGQHARYTRGIPVKDRQKIAKIVRAYRTGKKSYEDTRRLLKQIQDGYERKAGISEASDWFDRIFGSPSLTGLIDRFPKRRTNPRKASPRRRNKTVIVKPKRVLVVNGKKKAAKKRNSAKASPKAKQIRKDFTGMESRKTAVLLAPKGTPTNLAKLGKLVLIKTERGTIKPPGKGTTWLCADTKGKLHIATSVPYDGPMGSFGEVTQVEYETAKPHLGHKTPTIFFHKLGEEGGRKPTLSADKEGLRFRGGSYKITRQGIVD